MPLGHWGEGGNHDHSARLCSVVTGAQRNGVAMLGVCACVCVSELRPGTGQVVGKAAQDS